MASRRERMDEDTLAALVDSQIADARQYGRSDLAPDRDKALEFVRGDVDIPSEVGKSSVSSRDLSDVLNWIMPSLLRVFLASDRVVLYEPRKAEIGPDGSDISKARADQATDYVNYCFLVECDGYRVLQSAFYDSLLLGNGVVKHWWDATPEYKVEEFSDLSDAAYESLVQHEDVEAVLEHTAYPQHNGVEPAFGMGGPEVQGDAGLAPPDAVGPGPAAVAGTAGMAPQAPAGLPAVAPPALLHDCKIKRRTSEGRLKVDALAPEQFLLERGAKVLDETVRFCAHAYRETRSRLVEMGVDPEVVDRLGAGSNSWEEEATQQSRDESFLNARQHDGPDRSTELVDVFECYVLCDYDGDGIAERRKVLMAGGTGQRNILSNEEWADDLPFSDFVVEPVPHRWKGRSLFEEVYDVQRVKTVLLRQWLDNSYMVNNPMQMVLDGAVLNMDQLIDRTLGGNVFVKQPNAVTPLEVPYIGDKLFQLIEYMDQLLERRTGVSRATMALDMDALQNQTATAVNASMTAAATKSEFYARNLAELGMKRLFRCLLKLLAAHQDRPRTIRLRGKWVEMNPSAWDPEMDVSINTGLGSGNRERDFAAIGAITAKQEMLLLQVGDDNPLVDWKLYRDTLAKGVEAVNLRHPDQFFKEVTPEALQKFAQARQAKPDPKAQEAQARIQLEQQKAAADNNLKQQQAIADHQHKQQEAQARLVHDREKAAADMQLQRDKTAAQLQAEAQKHALELQLMREKAAQEAQLKREELVLEAQLKREQMAIQVRQAQATNIQEASPQ